MAQIIRITSEALQATVRRLLPSQQGFGEDLQASNVIQPIIDLTPTAEGSVLREDLQTAINFTDATVFSVRNQTTNLVSTAGFYRLTGTINILAKTTDQSGTFNMSDGLSTKAIFGLNTLGDTGQQENVHESFDFTVFLPAGGGVTLSCTATGNVFVNGSLRQVADSNANLVNPTGLTIE